MTFLIATLLTGCFGAEEPNPYADSDDFPIETAETGATYETGDSGDSDTGDSADTADSAETGDSATAGPPAPPSDRLLPLLAWAAR